MSKENDPLAGYVQTLLELQNREPERPMDEAALREIAQQLGWDDADWGRLEEAFERHLRIGSGFARLGNWVDAAAELEKALALKPGHTETRFRLAEALARKWKADPAPADRERAEALARSVLTTDPSHEGALRLVSELRESPPSSPPEPPRSRAKPALMALAAVLVGGMGLYVFLTAPQTEPEAPPSTPAAPSPEPAALPSPASTEKPGLAAETPPPPARADLPVRWEERPAFAMSVEQSRFRRFPDSFSYKLKAAFRVREGEITGLTARATLRDPDGTPLHHQDTDILADHAPPAWPGDTLPMGLILFQNGPAPPLKDVWLEIQTLDQRPAPPTEPERPQIPMEWKSPPPSGAELMVRVRQSRFSPSPVAEKTFHRLELGVENNGSVAFTSLKFRIAWTDSAGTELETREFYAATPSGPRFDPGQRRPVGGTFGIPLATSASPPDWALSVVDAGF